MSGVRLWRCPPGRMGACAFGLLALLAAAGCGSSGTDQAVKTVTVQAPSSKGHSSRPATFPALVARDRSGVIRIQAQTCGGSDVGTGFLLSPTLIATVDHVVNGASEIELVQDGVKVATGIVIGEDEARDLALVRSNAPIAGYHFTLATRAPQVGESVAAFGFPLGLPLTVTKGSVSGLGRTIPIEGFSRRDLVQTDTALNPETAAVL